MPKSAKEKKISSSVHKDHIVEFVVLSVTIVTLSLSMFLLSNFFDNQKTQVKVLGAQIDLVKEETFWKQTLGTTPTYRDGWIELAKIEKDMGNTDKAELYLQKATTIDPNFKIQN